MAECGAPGEAEDGGKWVEKEGSEEKGQAGADRGAAGVAEGWEGTRCVCPRPAP